MGTIGCGRCLRSGSHSPSSDHRTARLGAQPKSCGLWFFHSTKHSSSQEVHSGRSPRHCLPYLPEPVIPSLDCLGQYVHTPPGQEQSVVGVLVLGNQRFQVPWEVLDEHTPRAWKQWCPARPPLKALPSLSFQSEHVNRTALD